jgi:hypothetical protein
MSSLASSGWDSNSNGSHAQTAVHTDSDQVSTDSRISAVRDTLLVLGLQIVFRATLILRRWNY